ncbi:MAG: AAA-like domain-containing protein [Fimbriimonadaceae bacterium]|nr:AAA-like domain-containing protein [Fimbriimonadaceae bacterium]
MDRESPFFRPGGTMDPSAQSYIERAADARLLEALLAGEYVFVLDSRQKGKSSMVARTIVKLKEHGVRTVKLDLQRIGANVTPEQWYAGLLAGIGQELDLTKELFAYWGERQAVGPLARWLGALESVVLPALQQPLVVFVDEVDFVRALPFPTDEFFGGVRDCYNRRTNGAGFDKLAFCLVGVATPAQLVRNPEITPFNIGRRLELSDFTLDETRGFAQVLDAPTRSGEALLGRVHHWVNGHPYLTQLLCSHLAADQALANPKDVDRLVQTLFLSPEARQSEPNFTDVERRMLEPDIPGMTPEERKIQVLELYGRMLRGKPVEGPEENPVVATLRLSGIGHEEGGTLRVRNRTYQRVFDENWRKQRLPDAELRRQQGAARVAVLRTAVVAAAVVLAVSTAAVGMWRLSNDRQRSFTALQQRTNELNKVSNDRQTALSALEERTKELDASAAARELSLTALQKQSRELKELAEQKSRALADLQARTDELIDRTYDARINVMQGDLAANRWTRMTRLVEATADNPNRGWEWGHYALSIDYGSPRAAFRKWSRLEEQPDGRILVSTFDGLYDFDSIPPKRVQKISSTPGFTPGIRRGAFRVQMIDSTRGDAIRDAETGKLLVKARNYSIIYDVDPKRRRYLLFVGQADDKSIELRRIDDDALLASFQGPDQANAGRFLPDGTFLGIFATPKEGVAEVWHCAPDGRVLTKAPSDQWYASGIATDAQGTLYAAYGDNAKLEIRRVKDHQVIATLPDHPKPLTDVVFSRDGKQLLTGCEDGVVRLFAADSGAQIRVLPGLTYAIRTVVFLPDGKGWCAIDQEGHFQVWRRSTPLALEEFRDQVGRIGVAFVTQDNRRLVSTSSHGAVISRDLVTGMVVQRQLLERGKTPHVGGMRSRHLYWIRPDGGLERLATDTLQTLSATEAFLPRPIVFVSVIDRGRHLFVCGADRIYAVLDARTLKVIRRFEPKATQSGLDALGVRILDAFAMNPDAPVFAIFQGDVGKIMVFSASDGRLVTQWAPQQKVLAMVLAKNGSELVASEGVLSQAHDGRTLIYDAATGRQVGELRHPGLAMLWPQYSEKTGILATLGGGNSNIVFLWDVAARKKIGEFRPDPRTMMFYFSPDGRRIVTNSPDGTVAVWNSRTGEQYFQMPYPGKITYQPYGRGAGAQFSPDGRRLVLLSENGWVRLWNSLAWN